MVATLSLTWPTSVRTNFLVAHAGDTARDSAKMLTTNTGLRMTIPPQKKRC